MNYLKQMNLSVGDMILYPGPGAAPIAVTQKMIDSNFVTLMNKTPGWKVVSRAGLKEIVWQDLPLEEKKKIVLAEYDGKTVEFLDHRTGRWRHRAIPMNPFVDSIAYRIKPIDVWVTGKVKLDENGNKDFTTWKEVK